MADATLLTIPVAYNAGGRTGGLNLDDEPLGFQGAFSPYMKNMVVESTRLRKRQGYSRLGTGAAMSGIGMALVSYTDAQNTLHLIAFTTTSAYEYNSSTDAWDDISEAEDPWTGDSDNQFRTTVATDTTAFSQNGGSALLVVNNVDDVKYYEGKSSTTFLTLTHSFPSFSSCIDIVEFWNHLMFLGYTDTATRCRTYAFAGLSNVDDWTSATSGLATLTDTTGAIQRGVKLGSDLIIYSDRTISRCQYAGGVVIFVCPVLVQDVGLIASGAICNAAKAHFFMSSDQHVYAIYQGGSLADVGRNIDGFLFSSLSMSVKEMAVAGYDIGRKKAMFAFPTTGESYPTKFLAMNLDLEGMPWELHQLAHDIRSIATLTRTKSSAYVDDTEWSTVYCDETPAYCDDKYGDEGYDMCCFLTSDGYVYKLDEASGYDDTAEIDCEYQTEDIVLGDEELFGRFLWFSFTAKSSIADTSCCVYYSTDAGETWTALADSPVSLESSWTTHRLPLDVISRKIRFRLVQQGHGDLQLRSFFRIEVIPSTSRD